MSTANGKWPPFVPASLNGKPSDWLLSLYFQAVRMSTIRTEVGVIQSLCRMGHVFYYDISWRQLDWVSDPYNDLRWTTDEQISDLSFPRKYSTNSSISEGWKGWLAWEGTEPGPSTRM